MTERSDGRHTAPTVVRRRDGDALDCENPGDHRNPMGSVIFPNGSVAVLPGVLHVPVADEAIKEARRG